MMVVGLKGNISAPDKLCVQTKDRHIQHHLKCCLNTWTCWVVAQGPHANLWMMCMACF